MLGVARTATSGEIKKAYRLLALQHHPDVSGTREKFQTISVAYETLSDTAKKREYDSDLIHSGGFQAYYPNDVRSGVKTRPQTSYNPAGFARARAAAGAARKPEVDATKFNIKEWEAQHYGEDNGMGEMQFAQGNVRRKTWMNMGQNAHRDYFRRKERERQEKMRQRATSAKQRQGKGTCSKEDNNTAYEGPQKTAEKASQELARKREERQARQNDPKKTKKKDRAGADEGCVVC